MRIAAEGALYEPASQPVCSFFPFLNMGRRRAREREKRNVEGLTNDAKRKQLLFLEFDKDKFFHFHSNLHEINNCFRPCLVLTLIVGAASQRMHC